MQEPGIERRSPVVEEPERYVEADTVARAFAALTPRWQYTLWLTAVEQCPGHEVSARMQLSPNATAALAHRARQAFATAYLAEHVGTVGNRACAKHAPQLAAYVRGALTGPAEAAVEHHLVACRECAVAAAELRDVNTSLRSLSLPPPLVAAGASAATATVTTTTTGTAAATGGAATSAAASGLWAALSGTSLVVKGLAAVLLTAPAISAEHPDVPAVGGTAGRWVAAVPAVAPSHRSSGADWSAGDADGAPATPPSTASASSGAAAAAPTSWNPATGILPIVPTVSVPVVSTPAIGLPDVQLPAVVLPAIPTPAATVDLPPVAILDVAIVDAPTIELPALSLPGVTIPPLIVVGDPH